MQSVRIRTTVLPGNKIEVATPDLLVGQPVDVLLMPPADVTAANAESVQRPSALDIIEGFNGPGSFKSSEEVDEYLRAERESWAR